MNKEADAKIRSLCELIKKAPEAQYMIVFKGRSLPATFSEYDENCDEEGNHYLSISFWDGDSGNLFDVDYRLVPEAVFVDGRKTDF